MGKISNSYLKTAIVTIASVLTLSGCAVKGIPADDWIISKYTDLQELESFCDDLDDSLALYLTSAISQEEYLNTMLSMEATFEQLKETQEDDDIKPGSFNEITINAKTSYEKVWDDMGKLIYAMQTDEEALNSKDALSYLYLAYKNEISDDIAGYMSGYQSIKEK